MTDRKDHLNTLFESARIHAPEPSKALMARVLADAVAAGVALDSGAKRAGPKPGLLHQLWQGLGGWPALGGLATATCAGIWLGVSPPQSMAVFTDGLFAADTVSPLIDMSLEGAFDLAQEAM